MQPSKRAIVLHEYESVPLEDKLADRLHTAGQRAKKRLKENRVLERTRHGIKAAHVVGIVSVPGATLEILPKIDGEDRAVRKALVHMLAVAHNLRVADAELACIDTQRTDLLELLIALFAKRLIVAVRRGLPRRYVGHEEDLRRLRGSLNVVRQWTRLAARPAKLSDYLDEGDAAACPAGFWGDGMAVRFVTDALRHNSEHAAKKRLDDLAEQGCPGTNGRCAAKTRHRNH